MKAKATILLTITLAFASAALAQKPGSDPIGDSFFAPELLMAHQQEIGLTDDQREYLKAESRKAQLRFTELQWQLQDSMEALASLLKQPSADESQVLAQLDKVLNSEREIKRAQLLLMVRIKNRLTPDQQAKLQKIRSEPK